MECSSILSLEANVCDMNGHDGTTLSKDLNPQSTHPQSHSSLDADLVLSFRQCNVTLAGTQLGWRYPLRQLVSSHMVLMKRVSVDTDVSQDPPRACLS